VETDLFAPPGIVPQGNLVYYIVEWLDRPHFPGPNANTATFATAFVAPGQGLDGYMFSCYLDTVFGDVTLDNGSSATIGLNQYSSGADQYSFNTNRPLLNGSNGLGYLVGNPGAVYTATDPATVNVINPDIQIDPALLDVTHNPAPQSTLHNLTITNTGNVPLTWNITESVDNCAQSTDVGWLSVSVDNGSTLPGDSDPFTALLNSTGLSNASYAAQLCVASNDPDTPLTVVPVNLLVQQSPITPTPTTLPTLTPTATPTQGPPMEQKLYLPVIRRR
jgi:hypothetical protein